PYAAFSFTSSHSRTSVLTTTSKMQSGHGRWFTEARLTRFKPRRLQYGVTWDERSTPNVCSLMPLDILTRICTVPKPASSTRKMLLTLIHVNYVNPCRALSEKEKDFRFTMIMISHDRATMHLSIDQ